MSNLDSARSGHTHSTLCGAVLVGGKSSRMGSTKAFAELPAGESLLGRSLKLLLELRLPIVLVGQPVGTGVLADGLSVIPDPIPDRGPMGGLMGLLSSGLASHYLVLACDQPMLTPALLSGLVLELDERPVVFSTEDSVFPLPGLYPASLLPLVESSLSGKRSSLKFLLESANARLIALPPDALSALRGANTPQELREISAMLRVQQSNQNHNSDA